MTQTLTQTKPQFLTEALIEVLNNQWKVNAIESNRSVYHQLEVEEGRKYLKVWERLIRNGDVDDCRSCWMFVDKNSGECYKPASYKAPQKCSLSDHSWNNPHCDGSLSLKMHISSYTN